MTDTSNEKQKPDFYIFAKDDNGGSKNIGAAFKHAKGKGYNIVIGKARYVAFPPKPKPDVTSAEGEGA